MHTGEPRREKGETDYLNNGGSLTNLVKDMNINNQKLNKLQAGKAQRPTVRHILKLLNTKDSKRILEAAREKQLITHQDPQ